VTQPAKRPGYRWIRRAGCDCTFCFWKGNCRGEDWPHWVEVREEAMEHKLKGDTLRVVKGKPGRIDGIVAECECGWKSDPHFSSLAASVAFREHQAHPERP